MDELAIGLVIGLLRLPALLVAMLIGAQALAASQLGVRLGARLGAGLRERAERMAGGLLIVLGVVLAALKGHRTFGLNQTERGQFMVAATPLAHDLPPTPHWQRPARSPD